MEQYVHIKSCLVVLHKPLLFSVKDAVWGYFNGTTTLESNGLSGNVRIRPFSFDIVSVNRPRRLNPVPPVIPVIVRTAMLRIFRNDLVITQQKHTPARKLRPPDRRLRDQRRSSVRRYRYPASGLPLSPSPDSPVGCPRWYSVNVDLGFDTEDRLVLGLTLGRHLDLYTAGARRC